MRHLGLQVLLASYSLHVVLEHLSLVLLLLLFGLFLHLFVLGIEFVLLSVQAVLAFIDKSLLLHHDRLQLVLLLLPLLLYLLIFDPVVFLDLLFFLLFFGLKDHPPLQHILLFLDHMLLHFLLHIIFEYDRGHLQDFGVLVELMVLHAGLEVATVAVVEVLEEHVLLAG